MFPLSQNEISDLISFFKSKDLPENILNISSESQIFNNYKSIKSISLSELLDGKVEKNPVVLSLFVGDFLSTELEDAYLDKITEISTDKIIIGWSRTGEVNAKSFTWLRSKLELRGFLVDDLNLDLSSFLMETYTSKTIYAFSRQYSYRSEEERIDAIYLNNMDIVGLSEHEVDFLESSSDQTEDTLLDFLSNNNSEKINQYNKITANIATYPLRFESLLMMLESIKGQFDEVRIYLNNYDFVPEELTQYTTFIGEDLTDNGKFFWCHNKNEYYFTLDDDIIYPTDYVEKTLPRIKNRIVCYHGRRLLSNNKSYFFDQKLYSMTDLLDIETVIDVAGTGVMAFDTNFFSPNLWKTPHRKNSDLLISLEASLYGIKIFCLPKEYNWFGLTDWSIDGIYSDSIHDETLKKRFSKMIEISKEEEKKMIRSVSDFIFNRESNEKLLSELSNFNFDNFYHFNCGDGKTIAHISEKLNINFVGIEGEIDRIDHCLSKYRKSNIIFINPESNKVPLSPNSVILVNDSLVRTEYTRSIWEKLKSNSYLITTKKLGINPIKTIIFKLGSIDVEYMIYAKQVDNIEVSHPYQKSFIISLQNCDLSKRRLQTFNSKSNVFNNVEVFHGIKGRSLDYKDKVCDNWIGNSVFGEIGKEKRLTDGEIGCCMSHIGVFEKIAEGDFDCALILEDDASKYLPGFDIHIQNLFKELPNDWDIFLAGFWSYGQNDERITDNIYRCNQFVLAHSYFITKKAAKRILENYLPIKYPLDNFLSSISDCFNIYRHNYHTHRPIEKGDNRLPGKKGYLISQNGQCSVIGRHTGGWLQF